MKGQDTFHRTFEKLLGIKFKISGDEGITTCPFCQKKEHFHVNQKTGLWNCKHCDTSGNLEQFLSQYAKMIYKETEHTDYKPLVKVTRLPSIVFRDWSVGYDGECFLLHERINKKIVKGITLFYPFRPKDIQLRAVDGLKRNLYGAYKAKGNQVQTIWVCEGAKDTWTLSWLLWDDEKQYAVGVPSAQIFKPAYLGIFQNKNVVLCYDHDDAGRAGTLKAVSMLRKIVKNILVLDWPASKKEKFDVNDYYQQLKAKGKDKQEILDTIKKHLKPCEQVEWLGEVKDADTKTMLAYSPADILKFNSPTTQVEDLFLPEAFVVCAGEAKSGKTTLVTKLLCCIQCGTPLKIGDRELKVQQGQVVYITKEGKAGWQGRMRILEMEYGRCEEFNNMKWYFDAPMLDKEEGLEFLIRSIDSLDETPTIIAYDNLSRMMTGNENKVEDIGLVTAALDKVRDLYGCTNLLIHHSGRKEKGRTRGSSAIDAAADTVMMMQKISSAIQIELRTKLTTPTQRDLPPIAPVRICFRAVDIGLDKRGKTITALATQSEKSQVEKDGLKVLSILQKPSIRLVTGTLKLSRMAGLTRGRGAKACKWLLDTGKAQREQSGKNTIWSKINDTTQP